MSQNQTHPSPASVEDFIAAVTPEDRREEARRLDALFRRATGFGPLMWGPSIIGYGRYAYRYDSGRKGEAAATGFSPRKAEHSIYIMPGLQDHDAILARLGRHRTGAACLYVRRLSDIDMTVLEELVIAGLNALRARWQVTET